MEQLTQATIQIKAAFRSGKLLTTAEGNRIGKTVDFRKIVSRLRRSGMPIADHWTSHNGHRYKVYYLITE